MFPTPNQGNWTTIYLNFTVAGFADLTQTGYQLISGNTYITSPYRPPTSVQTYEYPSDLMLIGWNSTLLHFWSGMANRTVDTTFLINVNHNKIISPWNIRASINNVNIIRKRHTKQSSLKLSNRQLFQNNLVLRIRQLQLSTSKTPSPSLFCSLFLFSSFHGTLAPQSPTFPST